MIRTELIQLLRERGVDQQTAKDLFLYCLTTEDRQKEMFDWLKEHTESCDRDSITNEAQRILNSYLAKNPYNLAGKDMPVPKWKQPELQLPVTPLEKKEEPVLEDEDPFDKVLRLFFSKSD